MAISKKSYIDLSGLTKFRDLLLKTTIDVDNDTSVDNKTASVSAILEYVGSVETSIINGVNTSLNSKVQSVGYASKKFTYTTGTGTKDIVSISTLKTDIGAMTGATSSSAGAMGLVPTPASGKQTSFLRGDGTWAVPTDTNTTYTVASGDSNGQIKVTPSSGNAYNVSVKGLGSAAYTASSAYASASHNHDASYYLKTEIDTKLNGKSNTGHTHTIANITDLGVFGKSGSTASIGLVPKPSTTAGTTKFLREDGTWVVPTDNNTTYTFATGSTNGTISVKPSTSTTATDVAVKGLGSAAYTASSAYASASHNHDASYYLKTEIDTKLNGKSNTGHTHTIANITDLGKATSSSLGLVKSSTTGTTANRNYAVEVSSLDGTMKVNVPWTDNNVTSTASNTTKAYLVGSSSASTGTGTLIKDSGVYLDTTAGKLVATTFQGALSGNATSATSATNDSSSQKITSTYIKGLSASGQTVTYTKGDGTTATITTQDTKNTTGSTDTSSKIFLVGATSQGANPQTYSDNQVYATNGQLDANKVRVAEKITLQYNSTTESLDFVFA